jgi:hypothetical protein
MNSLEHRAGSGCGGLEAAMERRVLLLEGANPLAHSRRLWLIGGAVDMPQAFLSRQSSTPVARELLA